MQIYRCDCIRRLKLLKPSFESHLVNSCFLFVCLFLFCFVLVPGLKDHLRNVFYSTVEPAISGVRSTTGEQLYREGKLPARIQSKHYILKR